MTIKLPATIASYFAADASGDLDALANCFADDAVVRDEEKVYEGCEAILDWKRGAGSKYQYTVEPVAIEDRDNRTVVTSHLVGNFPGSPVDLRYAFRLQGQCIAELEIAV